MELKLASFIREKTEEYVPSPIRPKKFKKLMKYAIFCINDAAENGQDSVALSINNGLTGGWAGIYGVNGMRSSEIQALLKCLINSGYSISTFSNYLIVSWKGREVRLQGKTIDLLIKEKI